MSITRKRRIVERFQGIFRTLPGERKVSNHNNYGPRLTRLSRPDSFAVLSGTGRPDFRSLCSFSRLSGSRAMCKHIDHTRGRRTQKKRRPERIAPAPLGLHKSLRDAGHAQPGPPPVSRSRPREAISWPSGTASFSCSAADAPITPTTRRRLRAAIGPGFEI